METGTARLQHRRWIVVVTPGERRALKFPDYTKQYSLLSNFELDQHKGASETLGTRPWGGDKCDRQLVWHHDSINHVNHTIGLIDIGD